MRYVALLLHYSSIVIYVLREQDIVVVCCGGGGLLAGVAAAVKLSGSHARVVGVEPEGANSMCLSRIAGQAEWMPDGGKTNTIAHGLAPPFSGKACFNHVQRFVDDVITVSDNEMRAATRSLFKAGVVAEVSGSAAVAAVLSGRLGDTEGKKIVCIVTGRNIDIEEYTEVLTNIE